MEIWKPIPGYFFAYEVSNLGRVRRSASTNGTHAGRLKKQSTTAQGHRYVGLDHLGKRTSVHVRNLVAEAFLGPKPGGHHVVHKNGRKTDNRAENLKYAAATYDVAILREWKRGKTQASIARKLGCSPMTVSRAVRKRVD